MTDNDMSTRQKIVELREKDPHMGQAELTKKCGKSRQRIHQLLKEMELPLNPRNDFIEERVMALYEENPQGFNSSKTAKNLNCTKKRIELIIENYNKSK